MKTLQMSLCAVGVLALSACSNTWEGIKADSRGPNDRRPVPTTSQAWAGLKADWQDVSDWAHNKPSTWGEVLGPMPTGYAKKKTASDVVLKPPPQTSSDGSLIWRNVDVDANAAEVDPPLVWQERGHLSAPKEPVPLTRARAVKPVEYNPDVTVFPVDGDTDPYPMVGIGNASDVGGAISGTLSQQIFFSYGSSSISRQDSRSIHDLAKSVVDTSAVYSFNVVGHADKRVDHVKDAVRRKMINFAMAQQRADAVTRELANAGIEPLRVMAISRGDEEPNPNPGARPQDAADRRVDIYVDER